jgi:hypothetical protein
MSATQTVEDVEVEEQILFTCLSCSIAFPSAEDQSACHFFLLRRAAMLNI